MNVKNILLIHNYYRNKFPSGENNLVKIEIEFLRKYGYNVFEFKVESDFFLKHKLFGFFNFIFFSTWNPFYRAKINKLILKNNIHLVHYHNTFPFITPSSFYIKNKNVIKVLTLHNYRLICSAGLPLRKENICTDCIKSRSVYPAIKYGCYKQSRIFTLPVAFCIAVHRFLGTFQSKIDAYIVFSKFQKNLMTTGGIPDEKIFIRPNFEPGLIPNNITFSMRQDYVMFVGRLSVEKGLKFILDAWVLMDGKAPELRIYGQGPLSDHLSTLIDNRPDLNIKMYGQVSGDVIHEAMKNCRMLLIPSIAFEGFPLVLAQALSLGVPVIVSNIGPLPEYISNEINGFVLKIDNIGEFINNFLLIYNNSILLEKISSGAKNSYLALYSEKASIFRLKEIYQIAVENKKYGSNLE